MKRIYLLMVAGTMTITTIRGFFNGDIYRNILEIRSQDKEVLLKLEEQNLSDIENKINTYKDKYFKENEKETEKKESQVSYSKYFEDTKFIGDSITEGLSELSIIDEYNVISNKGDTVIKAKESLYKLTGSNPKNLVLLYGMNDVIEYDGQIKGRDHNMFKDDYINLIDDIKERLPNTNIYLVSPLPVMSNATNSNYRLTNNNIDLFRKKVKEVAEETEVTYVDIASLVRGKDYLYEPDGIHYKYQFYEVWLDCLKMYIKN